MNSFSDYDFSQHSSGVSDPFAEIPFDENAVAEVEELFAAGQEPAETTPEAESGFPTSNNPADAGTPSQAVVTPQTSSQAETSADLTQNDAEAQKRAAHEAAEDKRKQEWEARQQAKKEAEQQEIQRIASMTDAELMRAAMERAGTFTEKLVRRNMKECVTEHIQMLCCADPDFARMTMHPRKNMIRCFQYINRKAFEYVQDEMKADGFQASRENPVYAADIPDGVCYQWAEDYFRDPTVQEDQEKEEEFIPKPYPGSTVKKPAAKKTEKKKAEKKPAPKKAEPVKKVSKTDEDQFSFDSMMNAAAVSAA